MHRWIFGVFLFAAACSRPADDGSAGTSPLLLSPEPAARPIDVERAVRDPAELQRALATPAAALGAHRFRGTSRIRVTEQGAEVEALDEVTAIEQASDGSWHASYENSRDYGREAFYAGDRLWLRPRYGKFHRRPPTSPEEPAKIVADVWGTLAADFELAASSATLVDRGVVASGGRQGRKIGISAGPRRKGARQTAPQKQWRDATTVQSLEGEVVLDPATGVPLQGAIRVEVSFVRQGRSFSMHLEATHAVTDVGASIAITLPGDAESVDTPERSTEFEDREELLSGIARPARKAPQPSDAPRKP